jgi:hypothetical protein
VCSEIHAQFLIQIEGHRLQEKGMEWRAINTLTFGGAKKITLPHIGSTGGPVLNMIRIT